MDFLKAEIARKKRQLEQDVESTVKKYDATYSRPKFYLIKSEVLLMT